MTEPLTICTVSYRSASMLNLNLILTRELNPFANFRWLVVDNAGDFDGRLLTDMQEVTLISGDPCLNQGKFKGSYHHAQALNKAMRLISTRYLMVIDPDFFLFQKDWIKEILAYMSENGLSFWGAPYYPDLTWKRRYFPTVSCMLIDLQRIPLAALDFTPELDEYQTLSKYETSTLLGLLVGIIPAEIQVERHILVEIARVCLRNRWLAEPLSAAFPKRFYPNTNVSRDTGFKIQNKFGRRQKHQLETLQPAYVNDLFKPKDSLLMNLFARMYQLLVPEDLSIYPKRRDYTTTARFKDLNLPDVRGEFGWEEYFWKTKPFAMHMKGGTQKFEDIGTERLQDLLHQLAAID